MSLLDSSLPDALADHTTVSFYHIPRKPSPLKHDITPNDEAEDPLREFSRLIKISTEHADTTQFHFGTGNDLSCSLIQDQGASFLADMTTANATMPIQRPSPKKPVLETMLEEAADSSDDDQPGDFTRILPLPSDKSTPNKASADKLISDENRTSPRLNMTASISLYNVNEVEQSLLINEKCPLDFNKSVFQVSPPNAVLHDQTNGSLKRSPTKSALASQPSLSPRSLFSKMKSNQTALTVRSDYASAIASSESRIRALLANKSPSKSVSVISKGPSIYKDAPSLPATPSAPRSTVLKSPTKSSLYQTPSKQMIPSVSASVSRSAQRSAARSQTYSDFADLLTVPTSVKKTTISKSRTVDNLAATATKRSTTSLSRPALPTSTFLSSLKMPSSSRSDLARMSKPVPSQPSSNTPSLQAVLHSRQKPLGSRYGLPGTAARMSTRPRASILSARSIASGQVAGKGVQPAAEKSKEPVRRRA